MCTLVSQRVWILLYVLTQVIKPMQGAFFVRYTEHEIVLHLQILGRADKAVNFIRRGQEEALTEVTLSAGPGKYPLVIQRRLTKDNLSKYRVNGAHYACTVLCTPQTRAVCKEQCASGFAGVEKRRSDVVDLMKDLNVQLDNLCQVIFSAVHACYGSAPVMTAI